MTLKPLLTEGLFFCFFPNFMRRTLVNWGMLFKTCTKCQKELPLSSFYSRTRKLKSGCTWVGHEAWCKPCFKQQVKAYAGDNKSKVHAYQEEYRQEHRQILNQAAKKYRAQDFVKAKDRARSKTEKRKAQARGRWHFRMRTDPEFKAKIRLANKQAMKKWNALHPEAYLERARLASQKRRALKKNVAAEPVTLDFRRHLGVWQHGLCAYCLQPLEAGPRSIHMDHVVPLTCGGSHTPRNLLLACSACNLSKQDKLLHREWIPSGTIQGPQYELLTEYPLPTIVLSSFLMRDGCNESFKDAVKDLRIQHPTALIFWDFEWWTKRPIIESMIETKSGQMPGVGARKLEVVYPTTETAHAFLQENHIQGAASGTYYNGLWDGENLRALGVWKTFAERHELVRLAFDMRVIGGFSKLLADFRKNNSRLPIISYSDERYTDGKSYEKVGFTCLGQTTGAVMAYVVSTGIINRQFLMKKYMKTQLPHYLDSETERENALVHGYAQIWGLPQKKWKLEIT